MLKLFTAGSLLLRRDAMPLRVKVLFLVAGLCTFGSDVTKYIVITYHIHLGNVWLQLLKDRAGDAGSGITVLFFLRLLLERRSLALVCALLFTISWETMTHFVTKRPFDYWDVLVFSSFASTAHIVLDLEAGNPSWRRVRGWFASLSKAVS